VWDFPDWEAPLYPEQMPQRPGPGYFSLAATGARTLVCTPDGELYLHRFTELKPRPDGQRCWMVQVTHTGGGLAVYVAREARLKITVSHEVYPASLLGQRDEAWLPVAAVLEKPIEHEAAGVSPGY
jgi:hypothetical protein